MIIKLVSTTLHCQGGEILQVLWVETPWSAVSALLQLICIIRQLQRGFTAWVVGCWKILLWNLFAGVSLPYWVLLYFITTQEQQNKKRNFKVALEKKVLQCRNKWNWYLPWPVLVKVSSLGVHISYMLRAIPVELFAPGKMPLSKKCQKPHSDTAEKKGCVIFFYCILLIGSCLSSISGTLCVQNFQKNF